jgi:hypothetical protein
MFHPGVENVEAHPNESGVPPCVSKGEHDPVEHISIQNTVHEVLHCSNSGHVVCRTMCKCVAFEEREVNMNTTTSNRMSDQAIVKIPSKAFHNKVRFNKTLRQIWHDGTLTGCTDYQVMCKLISILLWGICGQKKIINYITYWCVMHSRKFDYVIFKRAFDFVDGQMRADLRAKWAVDRARSRILKKRREERRLLLIASGLVVDPNAGE